MNLAPRKKGFNDYRIDGDITTIYLKTKNGEILESLIDTDELEKVKATDYSFHSTWKKGVNSYYVRASVYEKVDGIRKCRAVYLHHLIKPLPIAGKTYHIDHINHNTLDNRKENLEIKLAKDNLVNRKKENINNTSGYRNVTLIEGKYIVQLQVEGKNTRLKSFDDVHEAGVFAEEMREQIYGKDAV